MTVFSHLLIFRHLWFLSFLFRWYIGRKCLFLAIFGCVIYLEFTTIAWFSHNTSVSGNGMGVSVTGSPFEIEVQGAKIENSDDFSKADSEYSLGTIASLDVYIAVLSVELLTEKREVESL